MLDQFTIKSKRSITTTICPLVVEPLCDCYCVSCSIENLSRALLICGHGYRNCKIFIRFMDCDNEARDTISP